MYDDVRGVYGACSCCPKLVSLVVSDLDWISPKVMGAVGMCPKLHSLRYHFGSGVIRRPGCQLELFTHYKDALGMSGLQINTFTVPGFVHIWERVIGKTPNSHALFVYLNFKINFGDDNILRVAAAYPALTRLGLSVKF